MRALRLWLALLAVVALLALAVVTRPNDSGPVCHSVTEDSVITDCDYRNGGWWQE